MPNNPTWEETTDAAPTWDETSDVATPDTDNAINAEKARNTLRDYSAGNIDLDEDHLHNAYTVATEGKSAAHRAGDWMLRALEIGANPIEQAQLATKFAGQTISTLDKAGHELARPVEDLIAGKGVGEAAKDYLKTPANVTAGLAQGTAQIPQMAAGVVNEVGDLAGQAMGVDTTKSDIGYYKFLHDVNHAVEKGGEAIGAEKDSGMKEIAATAPFMALPLGTAEAVSPFAARVADVAVEKGTQAAGKVISGAAQTAQTVGPAALAAAELKGGHYIGAVATLLAGYGGKGIPFFNKIKHFVIDKGIGAIDDLGKTLSRTEHGQTIMEKAQADIIEDANKVHARINAETAKLKPEQLDRINSGNYAPDHPILSKEEKAILGDKELLKGLEDKAARAGKWVDYNQIVSDAAKGGIQGLINTGAAATTGEAIASSTAPPEDVEAQKAGAGMGVGFAAPFILKLNKSGVLKMNTDEMVNSGKTEVDQDSISHLPKEQQDHVNAVAGFLKPQGWKVVVQNPNEFMQGPQNIPQAGHADPATKTIFLNSDKLGSGVGYHEMTHALGEALGWENSPLGDQIRQGLESTDPKDQAIVQSFLDTYRDAMRQTNPNFDKLPLEAQVSETMAELGRDILHTTHGGLAEFYRGKSGGKIIADMFRRAKTEPTAPLPTGYLNAPEIGGTRTELENKLYEAGKQAEQGKKPTAPPTLGQANIAPANPLTQHFDTLVRGLRSMGSSAADAKATATKVIDEAQVVNPNATPEDLMKRALNGRWPSPPKQFMPAEAPQTPEFKRWSEDAPVVLDSAPGSYYDYKVAPGEDGRYKVTLVDNGKEMATFNWNEGRLAQQIGPEGMKAIQSPDFSGTYTKPVHEFKTGEPVVVGAYHGTQFGKFSVFEPNRLGHATGAPSAKEGFFFSGMPETAKAYAGLSPDEELPHSPTEMTVALKENGVTQWKQNIPKNDHDLMDKLEEHAAKIGWTVEVSNPMEPALHEVYVKMKNPFVHDFGGQHYREESYYNLIKKAKTEGHDGVIFTNTFDGADHPDNIFAVFDNKNIKSTENTGRFDPNNPDIRFMPSEHPDSIDKPAIKRNEDGKIFPAKAANVHWMIPNEHPELSDYLGLEGYKKYEDGFVDKNGNFLDREQALSRAREIGQVAQNFKPEYAGELNATALQDAKLPTWSEFRKDNIKFMPSDDPRAISKTDPAYIEFPDGKVFRGVIHPDAMDKATEYYRERFGNNSKKLMDFMDTAFEDMKEGFITNGGEKLDREAALKRAKEVGQATQKGIEKADKELGGMYGGFFGAAPEGMTNKLEALAFNKARKFMPADIPDDKVIADSLSSNKVDKIGAARELPKGTPVGLRIDIPSYERTGNYVVTVHEKASKGGVGKVVGYDGIAAVDNPTFYSNEKGALKVKEGGAKFPLATVEGEYDPSIRELPEEAKDWTKVGFNPKRHSYFYDKDTMEPVTGGDKAISAGNTVYVKNPTFGNKDNFLYMPSDGLNKFHEEVGTPDRYIPSASRKQVSGAFDQWKNSDLGSQSSFLTQENKNDFSNYLDKQFAADHKSDLMRGVTEAIAALKKLPIDERPQVAQVIANGEPFGIAGGYRGNYYPFSFEDLGDLGYVLGKLGVRKEGGVGRSDLADYLTENSKGGKVGMLGKRVGAGISFMPADRGDSHYASSHQINIGLNTNDGKGITPGQAISALKSAGVDVLKTDIHQSNTEPTLVASLDRPLTPEEGDRVSKELKQEAIAQYSNGKGDLYGPEADKWKPFNPDYFLTHEGVPLRSTRTGSSGLWDATFVSGEGRELRKDLSNQFGANEDKHFFEQKPEVQQKIKDYFTGLGQAHFMPSDPKELKTYQEAIGQKFPEALLPQAVTNKKGEISKDEKGNAKPQKIKYRLDKTLMAQGKSRDEQVEAYKQSLVDYFNSVKDDPDVTAGIGWYEDARTLLKNLFGDNHKLFAQLLAATSKNEAAGQNMKYAVDTYNRWINGDFDDVIKKFEDAHQRFQNGTLKDGAKKIESPKDFDNYLAKHNIQMLQASGKKIGLHSRAALYALTGNFEQYINGLKLNQFSKNLSGDSVKATIDMWAARTLHRLGNEGNTERWRILPINESGIDEIDFKLGHDAFNSAAEELNMNPDDLQAALWFAEKKLYDTNGWSPLDYGDFREPLRKLEYKPESNTYEFPEGYKVNAKRKGLAKDLSDAKL